MLLLRAEKSKDHRIADVYYTSYIILLKQNITDDYDYIRKTSTAMNSFNTRLKKNGKLL